MRGVRGGDSVFGLSLVELMCFFFSLIYAMHSAPRSFPAGHSPRPPVMAAQPKSTLARLCSSTNLYPAIMSDEEMNIDDGMCRYAVHGAQSLTIPVAGSAGVVRRKGRGFQSSGGTHSRHGRHPMCCLLTRGTGGNESGVASEQTFDRVESTHGSETRAARCTYAVPHRPACVLTSHCRNENQRSRVGSC